MGQRQSHDDSVDRRSVLKSLGAGAVGASSLAVGTNGVSAATGNQVSETERDRVVSAVEDSRKLNELVDRVTGQYDVSFTEAPEVRQTTDNNGEPYYVAGYVSRSKISKDDVSVEGSAAAIVREGSVDATSVLVAQKTRTGREYVYYKSTSVGDVQVETGTDDDPVQSNPYLPITDDNCVGCLKMTEVVCADGCALGGAAICAQLGGGTIGALACAKIANDFCDEVAGDVKAGCRTAANKYCGVFCPDDPASYRPV